MNSALILAGASFFSILVLFLAVAAFLSSLRKDHYLLDRIRNWSGERQQASSLPYANNISKFMPFFKIGGREPEAKPGAIYANTPLFYQRAGIYNPKKIRTYQVLRILLLITPGSLMIFSYLFSHQPFNGMVVFMGLFLGYIGFMLPVLWLRVAANSRRKILNRTFPDAIDLMMVCVEAGMGLDAAIRRVAAEIFITSPELAQEFKILSLELKTGKSRNECLKNLAKRTNLPDVENLVSLLIQADKYGTGVANALRVHAEEMRQKRYARLEEQAAKLPVKLVVPLILCIFPALFVVILGPAFLRIMHNIIQG